MNLAGYRTRVLLRMGAPSGDTFFTSTVVNDAVNQALVTVEEEANWPWSEAIIVATLAAGETGVEMPDDWKATKAVYIAQWELSQQSITDVMAWSTAATGQPTVWAETTNRVEVRPVPSGDTELRIVYYRAQPYLTADTDRPLIPDRFHPAVIAKACEYLARREDDGPTQAAHLADYVQWLGRMRRAQRGTTRPVVPRVRPGSWYDW